MLAEEWVSPLPGLGREEASTQDGGVRSWRIVHLVLGYLSCRFATGGGRVASTQDGGVRSWRIVHLVLGYLSCRFATGAEGWRLPKAAVFDPGGSVTLIWAILVVAFNRTAFAL